MSFSLGWSWWWYIFTYSWSIKGNGVQVITFIFDEIKKTEVKSKVKEKREDSSHKIVSFRFVNISSACLYSGIHEVRQDFKRYDSFRIVVDSHSLSLIRLTIRIWKVYQRTMQNSAIPKIHVSKCPIYDVMTILQMDDESNDINFVVKTTVKFDLIRRNIGFIEDDSSKEADIIERIRNKYLIDKINAYSISSKRYSLLLGKSGYQKVTITSFSIHIKIITHIWTRLTLRNIVSVTRTIKRNKNFLHDYDSVCVDSRSSIRCQSLLNMSFDLVFDIIGKDKHYES